MASARSLLLSGFLSLAFLGLACGAADESGDPGRLPVGLAANAAMPFKDVKFLIEHNATAQDTGFQAFLDGDPWNELNIAGPNGRRLLEIEASGALKPLGLTELFFETNEPENAEVPIVELLAQFPAGRYRFDGRSVEGMKMTGTAILSHAIPAGPEILSPAAGSTVDPGNTVISWKPVTQAVTGGPVNVIGYEVIANPTADVHPPGFSKHVLSIHLPGSATKLTVPEEFLEPGTQYESRCWLWRSEETRRSRPAPS